MPLLLTRSASEVFCSCFFFQGTARVLRATAAWVLRHWFAAFVHCNYILHSPEISSSMFSFLNLPLAREA